MTAQIPNLPEEELEDLNPSPQKGFNFSPYIRTFLRKSWLLAGLGSLGAFAGWMLSAQDPYTYVGNFYLLVEPITTTAKLTNPTALARTEGLPRTDRLFDLDYPTNQVFLKSPGMTLKIAETVHKKELSREVPAIWKDVRENLVVERAMLEKGRNPETKIFTVSYKGENPQEVQAVLSAAAEQFLQYSKEDRETNIKAGVKFIDQQVPDLQQRLKKLQSQQKELRQKYELIDPLAKNDEILTQISSLKQEVFTTENQLKSLRTTQSSLQEDLNLTPDEAWAASTLSQDTERIALMDKLQELEQEIVVTSTTFTDNSPQVKYLRDQKQSILGLLNQTTQEILNKNGLSVTPGSAAFQHQDPTRLELIQRLVEATNQIEVLENQLESLTGELQKLEQQAKRYPVLINEYNDLERQIQLTEEILNKLLQQRETLKVESAQDIPWQLISQPQIPLDGEGKPIGYPPSPTKKLLAGLMGGVFLGMGIAVLWEKRRNVFLCPDDVVDLLSIPLLANIPKDDRAQLSQNLGRKSSPSNQKAAFERRQAEEEFFDIERIDVPQKSAFLEAFDILYAKLNLLQNTNLRSVVISSVETKDGQSTVAMNLAIAGATAGQRVLLVDANWYHRQLHDWLDVSNQKGLCQVLQDGVSPQEIIQEVPDIENLSILTAGQLTPYPPARLWSARMQKLMTELTTLYDLVIYDVPHFLNDSDVKLMAAKTDGILMVVGINKTPVSSAKKAVTEIQALNLPLLGVVTNQVKS